VNIFTPVFHMTVYLICKLDIMQQQELVIHQIPLGLKAEIDSVHLLLTKKEKNTTIKLYILYSIAELINSYNDYQEHANFLSGVEIPISRFKSNLNISSTTFNLHILFLITNQIVWRSKLSYSTTNAVTSTGSFYNDTYRYDIHSDIPFNTCKKFIYTIDKEIHTPAFAQPTKYDLELNNLITVLNGVKIDFDAALDDVFLDSTRNNIATRHAATAIYNIAIQQFMITRGKKVNRVYSNITALPSSVHKYIYLDNKHVSEVDAVSSQLTLMSYLTRKQSLNSDFHSIIDDGIIYKYIIQKLKEQLNFEILNDNIKPKKDFEINEGLYYRNTLYKINKLPFRRRKAGVLQYIDSNNKWNYIHRNKITKKIIKPLVFAAIFSGFDNNNAISKIFHSEFNSVINVFYDTVGITEYDMKNKLVGSVAATFLQNLEAKIWIGAASELISKGIPVLTKHDSMLFNLKYKITVNDILVKHYKLNGINIKSTQLGLTENSNEIEFTPSPIEVVELDINKRLTKLHGVKYKFKNKITNEIIEVTLNEFKINYCISSSSVSRLLKGKLKSIKGWYLLDYYLLN